MSPTAEKNQDPMSAVVTPLLSSSVGNSGARLSGGSNGVLGAEVTGGGGGALLCPHALQLFLKELAAFR